MLLQVPRHAQPQENNNNSSQKKAHGLLGSVLGGRAGGTGAVGCATHRAVRRSGQDPLSRVLFTSTAAVMDGSGAPGGGGGKRRAFVRVLRKVRFPRARAAAARRLRPRAAGAHAHARAGGKHMRP
jgi:hypothetical protein